MKVKELIEKLKELPQESDVVIDFRGNVVSVERIETDERSGDVELPAKYE